MRYVIRERFFHLGDDFDITDESGNPVLHVDGKVFSLHDRLVLSDPAGREVAAVRRKLVALRPTYTISIGGEKAAEVRRHFFTPFRDKFTIDIPAPTTWRCPATCSTTSSPSSRAAGRSPRCPSAG